MWFWHLTFPLFLYKDSFSGVNNQHNNGRMEGDPFHHRRLRVWAGMERDVDGRTKRALQQRCQRGWGREEESKSWCWWGLTELSRTAYGSPECIFLRSRIPGETKGKGTVQR